MILKNLQKPLKIKDSKKLESIIKSDKRNPKIKKAVEKAIEKKLHKDWQKEYDAGDGVVNPATPEFMKTHEYKEDYLYKNSRHHTKKIIKVDGTASTVEGVLLTSKAKRGKKKNILLEDQEQKKQYFDPAIKNKNIRKKEILTSKQININTQKVIPLEQQKIIAETLKSKNKRKKKQLD